MPVEIKDAPERKCRKCGCTDLYCSQCIVATGHPCHWVEDDLCSRCALEIAEKHCRNHESYDRDTCDDLNKYFDLWNRWNWTEVAAEGRRMYNAMFAEGFESGSAKDGVIYAVAAQAADGVFSAVAAMLDLDKDDLMDLVMPWYHGQDKLPPSVSPETLADYIRDTLRERPNPEYMGFIGE